MWRRNFSQNKAVLKKSQHKREGKLKKKREGKLKKNSQPDNFSVGISCDYLSGWMEPTEEEIIRLFLRHNIFIKF